MSPDYPLLGLLARKPASGYDLGKWLKTSGLFLGRKLSMSPIYRSLSDLAERGWIEYREDPRASAPVAKVYSLTAAGVAALQEWANSDFEPAARPMDPDFIIRLHFAGQLGPEVALRIVRTELEFRRQQRDLETGPTPGITDAEPIAQIDPTWLHDLDFMVSARGWQSTSWYIGWLESIEALLTDRVARETVTNQAIPVPP